MPYASGLVVSIDTRSVEPGQKNSFVLSPSTTFLTGSPSFEMAKSVAPPSVTSVPPLRTNSLMALTPSAPIPLWYSGGVVSGTLSNRGRPNPPCRARAAGSPVMADVESSAKMNTS